MCFIRETFVCTSIRFWYTQPFGSLFDVTHLFMYREQIMVSGVLGLLLLATFPRQELVDIRLFMTAGYG